MMRHVYTLTLLALLTACSPATDEGSPEADLATPPEMAQNGTDAPDSGPAALRGSSEAGAEIANTWCAECHAVGPSGGGADIGPTWAAMNSDPKYTDAYLQSFLTAPHGPMQSLSLSRQQIADLVAYIRSLSS